MRFRVRNPRAEQWLNDQSSRLVTEITESTREAIRTVAREALEQGQGPRRTALDIVGRLNRATGRREGGIIGLTTQQTGWASRAYQELRSGDPAQMQNYLDRRARDRRFDRSVLRAIREGRAIPAEDAQRMVRSYRNRLLRYRGETVARTETHTSLHAAQDEGLRQITEQTNVPASAIKRHWDATEDSATRLSHRALETEYDLRNGRGVGVDEPFVSPLTGARMMHPGDGSLGAPGDETINCRCRVRVNIDYRYIARR